jgi:hypothetical protein
MSVGFGSLWMMGREKLIRVALADNAVTEIPVKGAAGEFRRTVVGKGAVWVADNQTIYKIDPQPNLVVMTIPTDFPQTVPLVQIDPQTNSRRSRFSSPPGAFMGYSVAYGGGSLWLGGSALFRVKPPE